MADKLHPLTELLLARMESHPEEFRLRMGEEEYIYHDRNRWAPATAAVRDCGSEADKEALNAAQNVIIMQEAHEWALDELMNGDERRAKAEADRQAWTTTAQGLAAAQVQPNPYMNQVVSTQSLAGAFEEYNNTRGNQTLYQKMMKAIGL